MKVRQKTHLEKIFKDLIEMLSENDFMDMVKAQSSPNEVFKYRRWRCKGKGSHDDDVLEKFELHFANPDKFTDKNDCKNRIDYLTILQSEANWKKFFYKLIIEGLKKKYEDVSFSTFFNVVVGQNIPVRKNENQLDEYVSNEWQKYCKKVGVLSLASIADGQKLWNKYGQRFEGVCYGFDANRLGVCFKFQSTGDFIAKSVVYEEKLEKICPFQNSDVKTYKRTLQKQKDEYEWEHEVRIKIMEEEIQRNKVFSVDCLTRIIFGYKMSKEKFEEFKYILYSKGGNHIQLYYAQPFKNSVKITALESNRYWA